MQNCFTQKLCVNVTADRRDAFEVMHAFSRPLPEKTVGAPRHHDYAPVLGMPQSTISRMDALLIEKHRQLSAGKKGIYWALAKCKKGYSTIGKELWLLLVAAFNNHPHVIVLPKAEDTLQVKNAYGKKVSVCKMLVQVGLGTVFSNILPEHPLIKGKVGKHVFRYIISTLGCVRRFTNSYKQMYGCTKYVNLHTLHCLLQAKCGCNAPPVCDGCVELHQEGTGQGEGKGMERCCFAPNTKQCHHGGHMRSMEFACCAALEVPDAPVWRLQRVPHSKGGGTGGRHRGGHLVPHLWVQGVFAQGRQRAKAKVAQASAEVRQDWQVPLPLLMAHPWLWAVPQIKLHVGGELLEGEVEDQAWQCQHPLRLR